MSKPNGEYRVVSDDLREQLRNRGWQEPEDLAALREGKTLFWPAEIAAQRAASVRSSVDYARRKGNESRYLVTRTAIVDGEVGRVAWLEEQP